MLTLCVFWCKIHVREDPKTQKLPQVFRRGEDGKAVKISLRDCLACSGCITTAETVLLQQQSLEEFRARLSTEGIATIVSVSPQTRASLAVFYGLPVAEVLFPLTGRKDWVGIVGEVSD